MLFNSFEFIFLFLPITTLLYFFIVRKIGLEYGLGLLVIASLFFYSYWNPSYVFLIIISIGVNYSLGTWFIPNGNKFGKLFLLIGISINLLLLGYFKYANFFVDNINILFNTGWNLEHIFLPLAVSFFTFQQISYLVDAWQGNTREYNFLHYCLFVSFFPQLIAGPIVHHKEMLPQFLQKENLHPKLSNFVIGISIFSIGLFKKTVIADSLSTYVGPVYDNPGIIQELDFFVAWGSTLAYTFQLYFDFSGYSDMAIGCARIFGIKLPVNFFSPYKSLSIIEFWRRWHITLSRVLRDYLYFPLGGNRNGKVMRYVNLFITMLLGGLWHGAGWPFLIWGALHGLYLIINHAWRRLMIISGLNLSSNRIYQLFSWSITFTSVVIAWVYFRAPTLEHGNAILGSMFGMNGAQIPAGIFARLGTFQDTIISFGIEANMGSGTVFVSNFIWILFAGLVVFLLPNVAQIFHQHEPVIYENSEVFKKEIIKTRFLWKYSLFWAVTSSLLFLSGILTLTQVSEFLYFQF
jgi:alginate O-acetyltransferase complex protein AlgI